MIKPLLSIPMPSSTRFVVIDGIEHELIPTVIQVSQFVFSQVGKKTNKTNFTKILAKNLIERTNSINSTFTRSSMCE